MFKHGAKIRKDSGPNGIFNGCSLPCSRYGYSHLHGGKSRFSPFLMFEVLRFIVFCGGCSISEAGTVHVSGASRLGSSPTR